MATTSFAWLSLLFLLLYLHDAVSEELQFLKIPKRKQIVPLGSNLTLNCITNNRTSHTGVYFRRRIKQDKWKKIEVIPGKVVQKGQVYTLLNVTRKNKGQYQCRAQGSRNSTEVKWPLNVGIFIIRGGLNQGSKKLGSKRPGHKKPGQRKPGKPGKKRAERKKLGHKRPGTKKSGRKRPGARRPDAKRPGARRPGSKRSRPTKRPGWKKKSKPVLKLKPWKKSVTVNEGSLAVLKCTARVQGGREQPVISWYRSNKLIGCSNKKDSKCSAAVSRPYLVNYKVHVIKVGQSKVTSYLKIAKTKRARDKDSYLCVASIKHSTARQIIRLKINNAS